MAWEDIERAMQQAVVQASNYAATKVIWSYQPINQPTESFVRITFGGAIPVFQDAVRHDYSAARVAGQEIRLRVWGLREVPFEIEVFTDAVVGAAAARHVAGIIATKFQLPNIRSTLKASNISPFDQGPVNWVPDIPAAQFRGRATCTLRCYLPVEDCEEYTTYISRVTGTVFVTGVSPTGVFASGLAFDSDNA